MYELLAVLGDSQLMFVFAGMDLFEEALRRWEEALTFRSRQGEDDPNCASIKTEDGDTVGEQSVEVTTPKHASHGFLSATVRLVQNTLYTNG